MSLSHRNTGIVPTRNTPVQLQLEPRPTRQLVLKTDPGMLAAVDRIASEYRTTRSGLVRAFIRQGIQALSQEQG